MHGETVKFTNAQQAKCEFGCCVRWPVLVLGLNAVPRIYGEVYCHPLSVVFGLWSEGNVAILPVKVCREGGGITPCICNLSAE